MATTTSTNCHSQGAQLRAMFNKADKNNDGTLDQGEFQAYMKQTATRSLGGAGSVFSDFFNEVDANNDNKIDFSEFSKMARTAAQFAEDVSGSCESGPAEVPGSATQAPVKNDTGGQGQGGQGDSQEQDPVAELGAIFSDLGLDDQESLQMMIDQGLVDVDCANNLTANTKTDRFLDQMQTLMNGSSEGVNEVLGKRIEWLVDDGATWEGATQFMFDQDAVKADSEGNIVFNYPKGLTLNHYLCQMMDPDFRAQEQCGTEGLDMGLGRIYDNATQAGQDPIEALNRMLDSGLASINDQGQMLPTAKSATYIRELDGLMTQNYEGLGPTIRGTYEAVVNAGACPKAFTDWLLKNDMLGMEADGSPMLNDKGLHFNHDLAQLLSPEFLEQSLTNDPVDAELALMFDALMAQGKEPMAALNYLLDNDFATLQANGALDETQHTDRAVMTLEDFGVIA